MDEIIKYFPDLTKKQQEQLGQLGVLYENWNEKINVISRKDIQNLYERHVLNSLAIAKIISFKPGTKILDVGTGGGFPGLPLAIVSPQVDFLLVDSVGKKLKVVNDISEKLKITNLKTRHARAEDVAEQFDFVVSRAVTRLDTMWHWISPKIAKNNKNELKNGLLYLKGGDISAEIPDNTFVQFWRLENFFAGDFFTDKGLVYIAKKEQ